MAELLRISGLSAGYGAAVVLQDISLSLPEGRTLALLGRNGTGKSTLLGTLAGVTRQHCGAIELAGAPLQRLPAHARAAAGIGWVPQERCIFASLTVHENLTAVARPGAARAGRPAARHWTPDTVYALFPQLAARKTHMGTQLSGGEQQMLALGRALVLNPRLLLLDEPLEGLAPLIAEQLLRAIAQITREQGLSAIIVEQHPQAILAISDQAAVLERGSIVHSGPAAALSAQPALLERLLGVARQGAGSRTIAAV